MGATFIINETIGGISAGVVGTVIGYPFDVAKTRMQAGGGGGSSNFFNAIQQILRVEGPGGMYKGCTAPMLSLSILNALNFTSYGAAKRLLIPDKSECSSPGFRAEVFLAGCVCAPVTAIISTPEHVVKTQVQLDYKGKGRGAKRGAVYKNSMDCVRELMNRCAYVAI